MPRQAVFRVRCGEKEFLHSCVFSASPFFRMKGLLGRNGLAEGEGILLKPANQIHMFFMKFPIDAVFLDRNNRIVRICHRIQPWRISPIIPKAEAVVECTAGWAESVNLHIEQELNFSPFQPNEGTGTESISGS